MIYILLALLALSIFLNVNLFVLARQLKRGEFNGDIRHPIIE